MSAKNLSPRSFCILGLVCVAVIAGILYVTVSWEKTLLGTSVALVALVFYIIFKMSDGWMNSIEAEQIKSDQTRFTARIDRYRLSLSALPEGVILFFNYLPLCTYVFKAVKLRCASYYFLF